MAFCLTARNHYLNQWWLLMSEVLWHSFESNFTASAQGTLLYNEFKNFTFKIPATSPRGQWVNSQKPPHICHDIMSLYSTGYYWQCCGSFLHGLSWTSSGIISVLLGDKSYSDTVSTAFLLEIDPTWNYWVSCASSVISIWTKTIML